MVYTYKILKNIELVLLSMAIICFSYSGYVLLKFNGQPIDIMSFKENSLQTFAVDMILTQAKPYEMYLQHMQNRNLFSPYVDSSAIFPTGQLPANLKVVGISLGGHPQVVLEDINMHQSYFIDETPNQGMSIKSVESDKILLNYQGQTIEIPLKGPQSS